MSEQGVTIGERIEQYIKIRDKKQELTKRHKEELEPYNTALFRLETLFQQVMDKDGLENLKGPSGTAYKSVETSVTVADWDAFFQFVQDNEAWHMLEKRAAKTAVTEVLEETGEVPPGLDIKRTAKVNVRRS